MSNRYPGGFLTANEQTVAPDSASGVWTLSQQAGYQSQHVWPPNGPLIPQSLRFNSADTAYLGWVPPQAGNRTTWTYSVWVKLAGRTTLNRVLFSAGPSTSNRTNLSFTTTGALTAYVQNTTLWQLTTTQLFRDYSGWYHFVWAMDSTQSTSSERSRLYVNGVRITSFATEVYPPQNTLTRVNNTDTHRIGMESWGTTVIPYDGYMTEINFIDGQALDPSYFGQINSAGVWYPVRYAGTYGTNGFYLDFSDNSSTTALGTDSSGNGNNWTPNNFSVAAGAGNDSLVDTPTPYGDDTGVGGEVRGNYCTLNPILGGTVTLSNGALDFVTGNAHTHSRGTMGMTSGKWYWEVVGTVNGDDALYGIVNQNASLTTYVGGDANGWAYYGTNGQKYTNNSGSSYGASYNNNDVIGIAFDADAGTLVFYKNGVSQGTAFTGLTSGPYFPAISDGASGTSMTGSVNFGQRPFAYTAPSGFKALCTQNLPTPTVVQGDDYFNTVLYTGNGSTQSITGVGFQPDLVWIKNRSGTNSHQLADAVRGVTKYLFSDATLAEETRTNQITTLGSDGFSLDSGAAVNTNTNAYVAWNWNAGGSNATNTDGTITSTVRANPTAGFSIVSYTGNGTAGATVGHGLGVAPKMVIVKCRSDARDWTVYHAGVDATAPQDYYMILNLTDARVNSAGKWNDTAPTSSVFTLGSDGSVNLASNTFISYCFAEVGGFSKFGSYTGNGSADGPFVYCGFRPAVIIIKQTNTSGQNWYIYDTKRNTYNVMNNTLYPNSNIAETVGNTNTTNDFLSNGFKLRDAYSGSNASGGTYIFMAFAENPFKYSLAR